jgi:hypothetical protein
MTQSDYCSVFTEDLLDAIKLCHAGLAQDSPKMPKEYLNEILNLLFGYLPVSQRKEIDTYLAEKAYLPPLKLIDPNEMKATIAAKDLLNKL